MRGKESKRTLRRLQARPQPRYRRRPALGAAGDALVNALPPRRSDSAGKLRLERVGPTRFSSRRRGFPWRWVPPEILLARKRGDRRERARLLPEGEAVGEVVGANIGGAERSQIEDFFRRTSRCCRTRADDAKRSLSALGGDHDSGTRKPSSYELYYRRRDVIVPAAPVVPR